MNNINQYIIEKLNRTQSSLALEKLNRTKSSLMLEKLKVNSKSKINNDTKQLSDEEKDIISQELCVYFQESCSYKGIKYDDKLILLNKFFDNNIYDLLSKLDVLEDFCDYVNLRFDIDQDTLYEYIKANNDIFDYETKNIRSIRITNNILNATNFVTIDNKKQIEELLEAAKKDMLNQKPDDNRDMLNLEFTIDENSIPKDGVTHAAIRDYYFSNSAKNILEFLNNNGYSFSIFNTEKVTGIQVDMNNQSKIITDPDKINEIITEIYNSKDVRLYRDNPGYIVIKTFGDENWVAIGENQFSFME